MSSLLQFSGNISKKGVQLQASLVKKVWTTSRYTLAHDRSITITSFSYSYKDVETEHCLTCNRDHAKLYGFWRKPLGMWGQWVVFRYNGEIHTPDLSIPLSLEVLPRDAKPISLEYWHCE